MSLLQKSKGFGAAATSNAESVLVMTYLQLGPHGGIKVVGCLGRNTKTDYLSQGLTMNHLASIRQHTAAREVIVSMGKIVQYGKWKD